MKKLLLLTSLLALSAVTFAQSPTTIPGKIAYQGKLLENGLPVTGIRTIDFSIPGTGWTETHNNVSVTNGLYSVQLGSLTPIPVTVFSSPTVSLEITVEGTTLSPQVELLSVPYAYKADDAKTVNGLTVETAVPTGAVFTDTQLTETEVDNYVANNGYLTTDANNQNLTNLADPVNAQDAATKAYVDALKAQIEQLQLAAGMIKDYDGNVYQTVQISNQLWMGENLRTTHYANGDAIPDGTGAGGIWEETDPKYWFAYNDDLNTISSYGRLYTWYTVADNRNVCPTGWHVPTDAEWTALTNYLGGKSIAGGKLKEAGTTHWANPNAGATNETGFTALPSGYRANDGSFNFIGNYGYWWSATEDDAMFAWGRDMGYNGSSVQENHVNKEYGFSVRCIKD